jgi:hypothetical protein
MSNGKGDTPRPMIITDSTYRMRWDATFGQQLKALAKARFARSGIPWPDEDGKDAGQQEGGA